MGKQFAKHISNKRLISKIIKNLYNSVAKKQTVQFKNCQRTWVNMFPRKKYKKGQQVHEKMLNITSHWSEVAQSCPTLCNPMDCSLPGSSVGGIFQARVLEWVATSFSRGSSQLGDWTRVSCIAGGRFTL